MHCYVNLKHFSFSYLCIQFFSSRYAIPPAASNANFTSCFVLRSSFFFLKNDKKSPPVGKKNGKTNELQICNTLKKDIPNKCMTQLLMRNGFQWLMAEEKIQFTDLAQVPLLCKWAAVGYRRLLTSQC